MTELKDKLYARHEPISDPEVPRAWTCACGTSLGFSGNSDWLDYAFSKHLANVAEELQVRAEVESAKWDEKAVDWNDHVEGPPPGVYRHYKGPLYEVLIPKGHDADVGGRIVTTYIGLQLDAAHEGPRVAHRTTLTFEERVHRDGTTCTTEVGECDFEGGSRARFEFLGPEFTSGMLQDAVPL